MGFEAMPQIADLEIAATWDEIELEAALRGQSSEASAEPSIETPSCLADALRAVEALKDLPKDERKRRAEELLRALTSGPAASSPGPGTALESSKPASAPVSSSAEASAETAKPLLEESAGADPIAALLEVSQSTVEQAPSADTISLDIAAATEPLVNAESIATSPEAAAPVAEEAPGAEASAVSTERPPETPEVAEPVVSVSDSEPVATEVPPCATDAPVAISEPTLDAAATSARVVELAVAAAPEPAAPAMAASDPDAIPRFLTTECTALGPEQPDSLIPFRAVAAAGALIGAVLLVYFWSSQQFGVAARPIVGADGTVPTRTVAPKVSASQAARQAFVAAWQDFATVPQAARAYRPPFVGFDFMDDAAPPTRVAVKADVTPVPAPTELAVPQPSEEETAALPPSLDSDIAALIKRGDDLLKAGDVAAARSAYERAAAGGNPKAQIGVGRTYDPLVLAKLGARGVRGDPVQAAAWYARAGESGDEEGQQRLHALISGLSDCMLAQGTCASRKP